MALALLMDALLLLKHDLQSSLDKRFQSMIVSLDFSTAFDLVNYQDVLYKLKSMGSCGPVFNILNNILTNHQQHVLVHENFSQFKPVVSGVPQGSVLGLLLLILYTADMWNDLENKIVSYIDDTTSYTEVTYPSDRINVAKYLNRDLVIIQLWFST